MDCKLTLAIELNTRDLIGQRQARDRVLTDDELRAFWSAINLSATRSPKGFAEVARSRDCHAGRQFGPV